MVKWKYNFLGEVPPLPPLEDIFRIKEKARYEAIKKGYNITIDEIDYTHSISQNTVSHIFTYTPKSPTPQGWAVVIPVIIAIANAVAAYYQFKTQQDDDFREKTYNHTIETPELDNYFSDDKKNNLLFIALALILILVILRK